MRWARTSRCAGAPRAVSRMIAPTTIAPTPKLTKASPVRSARQPRARRRGDRDGREAARGETGAVAASGVNVIRTLAADASDLAVRETDRHLAETVSPVGPDVGVERRRRVLGRIANGQRHSALGHSGQHAAGTDALTVHLAHPVELGVTLGAEDLVEMLGNRLAQRVVEDVFVLAVVVEHAELQSPRVERLELHLRAPQEQPRLLIVDRVQPLPLLVGMQVHERVHTGRTYQRIVR